MIRNLPCTDHPANYALRSIDSPILNTARLKTDAVRVGIPQDADLKLSRSFWFQLKSCRHDTDCAIGKLCRTFVVTISLFLSKDVATTKIVQHKDCSKHFWLKFGQFGFSPVATTNIVQHKDSAIGFWSDHYSMRTELKARRKKPQRCLKQSDIVVNFHRRVSDNLTGRRRNVRSQINASHGSER